MKWIVRLVSMLVIAVGLAGCGIGLFPTDTLDQDAVAAFIGAPFPAEATNIYTRGESALDTFVYARFDLPGAQVAAYLQAVGITDTLVPNETPFQTASTTGETWWQPPTELDSAGNPIERPAAPFSGLATSLYLNNRYYQVVVVNPNAATATVYLQVFNT